MSFDAKVYKVLIASPGDVPDERTAISEVISNWNNINSEQQKVVLIHKISLLKMKQSN